MTIEGFDEILNIVYIAKKLFDAGKYGLVETCFNDVVDYDCYYEDMVLLIEGIFSYYDNWYYERREMEMLVVSDPVIEDFYVLSGEYGRRHNMTDANNPYIREAQAQVSRHLGFSYCIDWLLMVHTEPKRPFHSRLAVFIYMDAWAMDMDCLACRLFEIYEWFADACGRLRDLLYGKQADNILILNEGDAA